MLGGEGEAGRVKAYKAVVVVVTAARLRRVRVLVEGRAGNGMLCRLFMS